MARVNTLVFFPSQTSRTQASSFLSHSETPTPGCKKAFHRSEILRDPSRHLFNLSRTLCLTISTFLNPILTSAPQASRSSHPAQSVDYLEAIMSPFIHWCSNKTLVVSTNYSNVNHTGTVLSPLLTIEFASFDSKDIMRLRIAKAIDQTRNVEMDESIVR